MNELVRALRKMKSGKAWDDSGVVAEMIKDGNQDLHAALLDLFNDTLAWGREVPSQRKKPRLTVIYKKEDASLPGNYRRS